MHRVNVAIIGMACAVLTACSSGPKLGEGSSAVTVASTLPAPDKTGMSVDLSNYRLGPLDDIKIEVFGAPELTREGEVDAAGNFAMPLVGSVAAGGKTPAELASAITAQLKGRYLKNPQVSVNIVKAQGQTFTVDGAVKVPGVYPIVGKMTLQEAVATAKGADQSANIGNVVVFRTVNDRKMAALFNLKAIRAGQIEDPAVYGNDIIVVGESATRRFFNDLTRGFPLLGVFRPVM
jgi:polysaccharide export outer membrane protein